MKTLLHIKANPLFLLILGPYVFLTIPGAIFEVLHLPNADAFFVAGNYLSLISLAVSLFWWYVVFTELDRKLPAAQKSSLATFRIVFTISAVMSVVTEVLTIVADAGVYVSYDQNVSLLASLILLVVSVVMDVLTARALVAVETQREATWKDYGSTFFLFLFFFIGVFWIQPRVNGIFGEVPLADPDRPLDQL